MGCGVKCNLKWMLAKINMTQKDLATRVGVSEEYMSKVARAKSEPTAGVMLRIGRIIGYPIEEIWELEDSEQ